MWKSNNLENYKSYFLTLRWPVGKNKFNKVMWLAECRCGNLVVVIGSQVVSGKTKSCGCYAAATRPKSVSSIPEYRTWIDMIKRCTNANYRQYDLYGGRGITVCEEWVNSFETFLKDMGPRPRGMSLDRFPNNNGNYCPENCRWATPKQQTWNRRKSRFVILFNQEKPLGEWCEILGKNVAKTHQRIKRGWTPEEAFDIIPRSRNK